MEKTTTGNAEKRKAEEVACEPGPGLPSAQPESGEVQVISGASLTSFPLAGLGVSQARDLVGGILNIDPGAAVLVNGQAAASSHRLNPGDTLEFVHHAGEKGAGSWISV